MRKIAVLSLAAALGALCTTSAFAGMNDERVQKRDEIWKTETLDRHTYESKTPDAYFSNEILPQRQNTKRVMG
jgi:hypothetical protein